MPRSRDRRSADTASDLEARTTYMDWASDDEDEEMAGLGRPTGPMC